MDFNNIFNRVRKIKNPTVLASTGQGPHAKLGVIGEPHGGQPPGNNKGGLKKIATSRKVTTPKNKVHSTASTSSSTSSICNASCESTTTPPTTQPNSRNSKSPVTLQYSAGDSGIDSSTKKSVTQQDSTGSVLSGHVNLASELERRCQAAAKLAFKEETKEYKEKQKTRHAAMDLDTKEKQKKSESGKDRAKKKHRLKSDQSHARIKVDKIATMKRTSSSSDIRHSEDDQPEFQYSGSGECDSEDQCESSEYTDFADDESDHHNSTSDSANGTFSGGVTNSSDNTSEDGQKQEGEEKVTIVEVKAPKLIDKAKLKQGEKNKRKEEAAEEKKVHKEPVIQQDSIRTINKKYQNTELPTCVPSPSLNSKNQPSSRRVNGVTLRDLYSLRAVLSDSDNGTVFSGRRRIDNAAVAIKRIMKCKVKRWHMIKDKSVPMEIALLRKVNEQRHPGVVTLLEWFECSDCFLLVMARPTPVLDLFDFVSEKKRLEEETAKIILVQVLQAMLHCHTKLVLHRDIKLENVLVKTDTLCVTIIDFGCGTIFDDSLYKDFAGTPQYYPPEYYICKQYHGLPAAVWSVGVMLYAMLCGRLPFASAHEIVHLEPSWHGSFCRKISPAAKDLVESMLKKQPRRRLHMHDILKHRWLRGIKYNHLTGEVTILTDDTAENSPNSSSTQQTSDSSKGSGGRSSNV